MKFQEAVLNVLNRIVITTSNTKRVTVSKIFSFKPYEIARGEVDQNDLETYLSTVLGNEEVGIPNPNYVEFYNDNDFSMRPYDENVYFITLEVLLSKNLERGKSWAIPLA